MWASKRAKRGISQLQERTSFTGTRFDGIPSRLAEGHIHLLAVLLGHFLILYLQNYYLQNYFAIMDRCSSFFSDLILRLPGVTR